jgi:hypothetical protein
MISRATSPLTGGRSLAMCWLLVLNILFTDGAHKFSTKTYRKTVKCESLTHLTAVYIPGLHSGDFSTDQDMIFVLKIMPLCYVTSN